MKYRTMRWITETKENNERQIVVKWKMDGIFTIYHDRQLLVVLGEENNKAWRQFYIFKAQDNSMVN